jgi:hypothetical protein
VAPPNLFDPAPVGFSRAGLGRLGTAKLNVEGPFPVFFKKGADPVRQRAASPRHGESVQWADVASLSGRKPVAGPRTKYFCG